MESKIITDLNTNITSRALPEIMYSDPEICCSLTLKRTNSINSCVFTPDL